MIFESGDDTARFFYLALLGSFLLWSVFLTFRHRLSAALRDIAIWGLIFCTLIIGYGFKDVFLAQLFPGNARSVGDGQIAISRASDGHFRANVMINGERIPMLIDTGASDIVLSREDASRAGIDTARLNFIGRAFTANGAVSTARVTLNRMELGGIVDFDVPAEVNGGELHVSLLGLTYLDRFASWQVRGDTMFLER